MVIAILGVWQTGAVPIPIDASKPSVRWMDLIADTHTSVAIACEDSVRRWITDAQWKCVDTIEELQLWSDSLRNKSKEEPLADQKGIREDLAYVLYTSGTTGRAKGVMVGHQSLSNTIGWRRSQLTLRPGETVLWTLSHQFDAGLATMLTTLTQGGTLCCVEPTVLHDMESMTTCIMEHQIAAMSMVPSQLRLLIGHRKFSECTTLRQFWVGGESMPRDLPSLLQKKSKARLWNLYGPTEATIEATAYDATDHPPSRSMLIGEPIQGMSVLVLDESMQPLPLGVPGKWFSPVKGLPMATLEEQKKLPERLSSGLLMEETSGSIEREIVDGCIPMDSLNFSADWTTKSNSEASAWNSARSKRRCSAIRRFSTQLAKSLAMDRTPSSSDTSVGKVNSPPRCQGSVP